MPRSYDGTLGSSLIGKTIGINQSHPKPYRIWSTTPAANQIVFDCALACIDAYFCKHQHDNKMLLWVLPSAMDKLGHDYGPDSLEVIDMLYHLDRQIKTFIDCVNTKTQKRKVLWVLTTDHGMCPLPEQMHKDGYKDAHRIMGPELVTQLNAHLHAQFGLSNIALHFHGMKLYVNEAALHALEKKERKLVKREIKRFISSQPGIKAVWSLKALQKACFQPNSLELLYQNQLFAGRTSSFITQTYPYSFITNHPKGSSHRSPYNYDTHIPLVIYQRAHHQRKVIEEKVFNTQLAPTLAHILDVPKPSACMTEVLPGIIFKEDPCF